MSGVGAGADATGSGPTGASAGRRLAAERAGVAPAWTARAGSSREFGRTRNAAYWIFVGAAAVGCVMLGWPILDDVSTSLPKLGDVAFWALAGLGGYAIVTRADLNWSVPGKVRLAALAWGVCCVPLSQQLVGWAGGTAAVPDWWRTAGYAPLFEEAVKLLGVVLIAFGVPAVCGRPLGALVLGMLSGLGFTIVRNLERGNEGIGAGGALPDVLLAHSLGPAPWAHLTCTGIAALGIWWVVAYRNRPLPTRILLAAGFFLLAVAMHILQDAFGRTLGRASDAAFADLLVPFGYAAMQLLVLVALVLWARWRDRWWFRTLTLAGLPPVLDTAEAASLRTRGSRRRARRAGVTREVQKTQLRYANAISDGDDSTAEDMLHRERLLRIGQQNRPV